MRETEINCGQGHPRRVPDIPPAEIETERAAPIRWVTVIPGSADPLRGAVRRDGQGPYLLCGCGQVIRPGDELLAAGEHFYCPDCAQRWLAANLSRLGGMFP